MSPLLVDFLHGDVASFCWIRFLGGSDALAITASAADNEVTSAAASWGGMELSTQRMLGKRTLPTKLHFFFWPGLDIMEYPSFDM